LVEDGSRAPSLSGRHESIRKTSARAKDSARGSWRNTSVVETEASMTSYLVVESRDPLESNGFARRSELAAALAADGASVTVFLVENGVIAARASARLGELEQLAKSGVAVLADEFSLRERGIAAVELAASVKPVALETVVEQMVAGARVLWN
jgi:sulfur relay (sulfurtransferase) complex TusBCD TusD component (DsrE family)